MSDLLDRKRELKEEIRRIISKSASSPRWIDPIAKINKLAAVYDCKLTTKEIVELIQSRR